MEGCLDEKMSLQGSDISPVARELRRKRESISGRETQSSKVLSFMYLGKKAIVAGVKRAGEQ